MSRALIFAFMPLRKKDELHTLIHSLGKGEKKFFRMLSSATDGVKNYVRLFSAIEKMKVYDEQKVKRAFAGTTLAKNLASEKQYLLKQIIYSLRVFHAENSASLRVDSRIAEIEALMDKRMFNFCKRLLQKAKEEAEQNELQPQLMSIHHLSAKLAIRSGNYPYLYKTNMDALPGLRKTTQQFLEQEEMRAISYKIFSIISKEGNNPAKRIKEIDRLMKNPLLTAPPKNAMFYTMIYYYQAHNFYQYHKGNIENAYKLNQTLVQLFEKQPEKIRQNAQTYFSFLRNLSNRAYVQGRFAECYQCLTKIERLDDDYARDISTSLRTDIRINAFEIRAELLYTEGKFVELVEVCQGAGEFIQRNAGKLRIQNILFYNLFSAIAYAGIGKSREALVFVNRILNDDPLSVRQDMILFAHVLNVRIHYDLKNMELIRSTSNGILNYNNKNKLGFEATLPLHKMFIDLLKANEDKVKCKHIIGATLSEIKPLLKVYDEKRMLHITGIWDWMKAKI